MKLAYQVQVHTYFFILIIIALHIELDVGPYAILSQSSQQCFQYF